MYKNIINALKENLSEVSKENNSLLLRQIDSSIQHLQTIYLALSIEYDKHKNQYIYIINATNKIKMNYLKGKTKGSILEITEMLCNNSAYICPFIYDINWSSKKSEFSCNITECILENGNKQVCDFCVSTLETMYKVYYPDYITKIEHSVNNNLCKFTIYFDKIKGIELI